MERRERGSHLAREIVEIIALTILIFLAIRFTVQNYQISGPSMENNLHTGQFVLVNKLAYLFHQPERGDVIVLHQPDQPDRDLIKRVIGLPGDTIVLTSNSVTIDGVKLNEPYVTQEVNPGPSATTTRTVPPGEFFVMGDNRPVSEDSRYFGFVPKDYIVGKAMLVYWPLNQWQLLNTYPSVFSQIK
ncbi:MAG TPA: signal peptidase I [Ktedonobacteraceae bacterium]|nr:signal peptidase I [Ktedonobacteraceae bacterium]